ncbi:hypothetical protein CesoFtcFv8_027872 [Champsocephalus esox]|uniref:Uncharacterized protein n=1 Tax=Champsocephalus esox TaxID=159716 RepID=A0AAN8G889_9TELE|nr:hypothetical protein CesoFtcFv8_027872 [Champsocephalus esox]
MRGAGLTRRGAHADASRFLTAREVLGKLYANAAAQDSTDSSSEEGEEEMEKEEHGEDEPGRQGVRGEEDALEYGDEVRVYEDKDHEEEDEERVSRGQRKEQSGHRETRGRNPEPEAQSSGDVPGANHRAGAEEEEEEDAEEEEEQGPGLLRAQEGQERGSLEHAAPEIRAATND